MRQREPFGERTSASSLSTISLVNRRPAMDFRAGMALVFQCCCKWRALGRNRVLAAILFCLLTASSAHAAFFDAYDWEARNWKQRVLTNAYADLPGKSYLAGITWMKMVRQAGLRDRVLRANLCIGGTVSGSPATGPPFVCIINDVGSAKDSTVGTPTYTEADGFTTGADGDCITTAFNPTNLTANDAHLAVYFGGTAGAEATFALGVTGFAGNDFYLATSYPALGQLVNIWTGTGRPVVADTDGRGFYVGVRTSSATNGVAVYRNGLRTGNSTSVGGSPPNTVGTSGIFYMSVNNGGSPLTHTTRKGRGYQVGRGLTDAQVQTFYTIWQQLENTFGRVSP